MKKVIVFSSGQGSNLNNIINYFKEKPLTIDLIVSNKITSGSLKIAEDNNINSFYLNNNWNELLHECNQINPDLIVLSGFLLKVPQEFIQSINCQIINIHPSLLPKYGGKGMYGRNVHKSVIQNKEEKSGITIHYVNKNYDEGKIIFQKELQIDENMNIDELEFKIHQIEYDYFPKVIESLLWNSSQ